MKKIIFLLFSIVLLSSCEDKVYKKISGDAQGTTYHIIYNKDADLQQQVDSILEDIDKSLSNYRQDAILYRINNNEDVKVDEHFKKNFKKAEEISKATNGIFDITVGPLVQFFGFGNKKAGDVLDSEKVDSLRQFVGFDKIKIVNDHLVKDNPGVKLDFNAIAQGYSVDVIADYFDRLGIDNYMIELGGEVLCKGHNEYGNAWRIGVEKPIENTDETNRKIELILGFKDVRKAVSTSGNYRKFYVKNGVKFTHTINPITGYPLRDSLVSATILANDCMTADGYATACMASGYKKAVELVEKHPELEAFLIYINHLGKYKFYFSKNFKQYVIE